MIAALYKKLRELNITIEVVDGRLDIHAPKGVLQNELLEEIKINKELLIDWINRYKQKEVIQSIPSIEINQENRYPLSANQRRMWIFNQFEEGSAAYNIYGAYLFEGNLEIDILNRAFNSLVERHEILRTVFEETEKGEVKQVIQTPGRMKTEIFCIDIENENDPEKTAKILVQKEIELPFDFERGPLLRVKLISLTPAKHLFVYVMHHIISDGSSMGILIKELQELYNAFSRNQLNPLNTLRIQYKDFVAWQTEQLKDQSLHKDYWIKRFSGEIPVIELPFDYKRPLVKTYAGGVVRNSFDLKTIETFNALNRKSGCTLFMGLLAAVKIMLLRYTGQGDIIVGTPVVARDHADLEEQIGFYSNTLALRTLLNNDQTFEQVLQLAKQTTLEAYEHQVYPFDVLIENLSLKRDLSRNALFDVMIAFQEDSQESEFLLGELNVKEYQDVQNPVSKFDLTFEFTLTKDKLEFLLEYNSDLFDYATIERMSFHFESLLNVIIQKPYIPVGDLDYLTEKEKSILTFENPAIKGIHDLGKTIVELFEEQVERSPDAIAVVFAENELSYRALNNHANRFADYLRKKYVVSAGDLLAIKLKRSEKLLIAILGVLKSGCGYVPVDPDYPSERIDFIRKDSNCKVLIGEEELKMFSESEDEFNEHNVTGIAALDDIAYCIYTSGSSGIPKGVAITHRSLQSRILAEAVLLEVDQTTKTCLSTNCVFDVSLLEIFLPLVQGGCLVIPADNILFSSNELGACLSANGVTLLQGTPSFIGAIILGIENDEMKLKRISIGGESLNANLVQSLKKKWPHVQINNHYGPTECTIDAIVLSDINDFKNNSIGSPIPGTSVLILDARSQLVPVGILGEICIGGIGLAKEYINQPELTKEKFIDNPFRPGERLYKTGDIGRWLADGTIEFTGRKDDQVKMRGYRIELGEIEARLLEKENISEAVVLLSDELEGGKELVAYIVSGSLHTVTDLRLFLKRTLPDHMIPNYFIQIEKIPLTPNGKVDKKALPSVKAGGMANSSEYIAPRNEMEERTVEIIAEILDKSKQSIGINDNFFDIGITSLKLMKLLNMFNKEFNLNFKVVTLFQYSTVDELIRHVYENPEQGPGVEGNEGNVSLAMDEMIDLM